MPAKWPLREKILQIKGNLTYRELAEAVYQKTGKKIHYTAFAKMALGKTIVGRPETIIALAEYANKPLPWFYEEDSPAHETVAEEHTEYLLEKERRANEYKRQLMEEYISKGRKMTPDQLELINKIVDEMIEKNSTKP